MSKPRSDSTLASLTEEQRDQLYDWLSSHTYPEVQKLAAQPAAEGGFDLQIHRTTLARFFEAEQSERQARELAELAAAANNGDVPHQIEALIEATRQKFIRATYELGKIAATDRESYDRVENALHHMDLIAARRKELEMKKRELDQEDKRMEEQRRQWEYNAARAAINHMPALQKIYHDQTLDPEDKIWAAREVCFGKPPGTAGVPPAPDSTSEPSVHPSSLNPQPLVPSSGGSVPSPQSSELPQRRPTHSDTLKHDNATSPLGSPGSSPATRSQTQH